MSELIRATTGESFDYFGNRYVMLADAAATDGLYGLMMLSMRAGREPPLHTHTREEEAYWVISGRWTFFVAEETFEAGPGAFVQLPRGVPHRFTVDGDGASALILVAPAGLEEAFRSLGRAYPGDGLPPLPEGPPDVARIMQVMAGHGLTFAPRPAPS